MILGEQYFQEIIFSNRKEIVSPIRIIRLLCSGF
jgi:hypothetical protein